MATDHSKYAADVFVLWGALAIGWAIAATHVRKPSTKLLLIRSGAVTGAIVFLGVVWFLSGSLRETELAIIPVAVIATLNLLLVKVCPRCAATLSPRYFLAAAFCSRCGASLTKATHPEVH